MIEIVREAELACAAQLEDLNERMRRRAAAGTATTQWRRLMGMIVTAGDVAWWDARIKWLQALRQYLQREGQRYEAEQRPASSLPTGLTMSGAVLDGGVPELSARAAACGPGAGGRVAARSMRGKSSRCWRSVRRARPRCCGSRPGCERPDRGQCLLRGRGSLGFLRAAALAAAGRADRLGRSGGAGSRRADARQRRAAAVRDIREARGVRAGDGARSSGWERGSARSSSGGAWPIGSVRSWRSPRASPASRSCCSSTT